MMNKTQYLLSKIAEEASEVAQVALKAQQFGLDNYNPFDEEMETNAHKLFKEYTDLTCVLHLLEQSTENNYFDTIDADELFEAKMRKTRHYYIRSQELGMTMEAEDDLSTI